jgi:hypothetical protein
MLPTYLAEDKNILYYTLNFLENKRKITGIMIG